MEFFENIVLVSTSLGFWRGSYQTPKDRTEVRIDGAAADDFVKTPHIGVVNDKTPVCSVTGQPWKAIFAKLGSSQEKVLERYSLAFPITGVRMIPVGKLIDFLDDLQGMTSGMARRIIHSEVNLGEQSRAANERLQATRRIDPDVSERDDIPLLNPDKGDSEQSIAYQLRRAAVAFADQWSDVRRQIRASVSSGIWEFLEKKLPSSREKILQKFHLDVIPVQIAGGSAAPVHVTEDVVAQNLRRYQSAIDEACRRKVDEAVEIMVAGPRRELGEAIAGLQALIGRDGRVTAKSFNPLREAIRKIRLFECVADESLLARMRQLESALDRTPAASLNSETFENSSFREVLDDVVAQTVTDIKIAEARERAGAAGQRRITF